MKLVILYFTSIFQNESRQCFSLKQLRIQDNVRVAFDLLSDFIHTRTSRLWGSMLQGEGRAFVSMSLLL